LTPERAFLARVFVAHCIATKDEARLESALPVVTALAFRIQEGYNALLEDIQAEEERVERDEVGTEEARQKREDERMDREFVIGEMLKLAVDLDYADEIGRRKMFQLVREYYFLSISWLFCDGTLALAAPIFIYFVRLLTARDGMQGI
jgi:condensin complex subunit 3